MVGFFATSDSGELERLLLRMSRRDEAAFEKLHAATKRKLFSTVLQVVKRSDLAEELLQETYARIWQSAGSYRSSLSSPMTWMITIARNLAIDSMRKAARQIHCEYTVLLDVPADDPTALDTIETRENESITIKLQRTIFSALQGLEPDRRQLVIAAYVNGESRHRLSQQHGVPVNTIKTWIRRALLEVRAQIGAMPPGCNDLGLLIAALAYQDGEEQSARAQR